MRIEHEYQRQGVCAHLAARDVHRARLFGKVVEEISIAVFDALVAEVMSQEPYRAARRVCWIVDGGTIHRGQRAIDRIEIYFSILQRKALTPADFASQDAVAERILGFQDHHRAVARPFESKFTRRDLQQLLQRWAIPHDQLLENAA